MEEGTAHKEPCQMDLAGAQTKERSSLPFLPVIRSEREGGRWGGGGRMWDGS